MGSGKRENPPIPHYRPPRPTMYPAPSFESKICPPDQLRRPRGSLPRPLVFTNGCFDILHRGHVTYLGQAGRWASRWSSPSTATPRCVARAGR